MKTPSSFVSALCDIDLVHVFNPYARRCDLFDLEDAPAVRRQNLTSALEAAIDQKVRTIWIARDLGYRGGRRTGLALTDEVHLPTYSRIYNGLRVRKATAGPPVAERTAAVIWKMLARINEPVFLWNVFPLHPHEPDEPMSNRCHTTRERHVCESFMFALLDMLQPSRVIGIGGDARRALDQLGIACDYVRHPSYGGQSEFVRQLEEVYGLAPEAQVGDLFKPI